MANMATMIMEGASYGSVKLDHHYDHENGAGLIAMESAEALHSIFESVFYTPNSCEIQAALEGASCVEESSQAAIMEGAIKGALAKIKDFFVKLKEKVKDFLHNIKRYLAGIFQSDEKWVTTYEKELKALKSSDLKGYKIKMYTYTISAADTSATIVKEQEAYTAKIEAEIDKVKTESHGKAEGATDEDALSEEGDQRYLNVLKNIFGKAVEPDEVDKEIWSKMRNGAESEADKDDVDVAPKINTMIEALKKSSKELAAYDNAITKTDAMYNKILKLIDKEDKRIENLPTDAKGDVRKDDNDPRLNGPQFYGKGAAEYITKKLHALSSQVSKAQTLANKFNTAEKAAYQERNSAYKSALTGAFGYVRKHKGGK